MKSSLFFKQHIAGFTDVVETVQAEEKIAATQIHFLKAKVSALDDYTKEIGRILSRVIPRAPHLNHPLLTKQDRGTTAILVITGGKGLVGDLYHNMVNAALAERRAAAIPPVFVAIGSRGERYLSEEGMTPIKTFDVFSELPKPEEIRVVTDYIFSAFLDKRFSSVVVLYPQCLSLAEQVVARQLLLPFSFIESSKTEPDPSDLSMEGLPIFDASPRLIFDFLLGQYIEVFFAKIIFEAKLSEFSARTVAMEHASIQTREFIHDLLLEYRKERRRELTEEGVRSFAIHNKGTI